MAGTGAFPKLAGDTVFANDYNTIYNSLAAVVGVGSGASGYGATLTSAAVSQDTVIYGADWEELKNDILNARKHQIGAGTAYNSLVTSFATATTAVTTNGTIGRVNTNLFKTTVDTIVTNKDTAAASQLTKITGASSSYTPSWNGAITHTVTVTFATSDDARNFFNAGGYLINDLSSSANSGSSKDNDWEYILTTATGAVYTAANYRGATANVVICSETYGSSYGNNYFKAWGHRTSATTIKFTMLFDDASTITGLLGSPTSGTVYDESVTLNITSAVNYYKSFDAIVSPTPSTVVATPFSVIRTDTATAGLVPGFGTGTAQSATLSPSSSSVNEGATITIFVLGSNLPNGTYYWTVTNSGDFGSSQGTVSISGNSGSFTVSPTADSATEGSETFTVSLWSGAGGTGTLYDTTGLITINDTSTGAVLGESLTGVGATFTIGATLTYNLTGGTPNSTATYSWTGTKPDGTAYTGLAGATVTLNGSGAYSQSGAFLTAPGTFTLTVVFNATGTTRSATTVSEIPASLTYSGISSLGQDQVRVSVTSNYGYSHSYATTASASATFDEYTGNPASGTLSGGATSAILNLNNPHAATTVTTTVSMAYCTTKTLTVSVPSSTEVFTASPTTANDGDPILLSITGGVANGHYDFFYQSDLPGYGYTIGGHPAEAATYWEGWSKGRTDAILSSTGTKSLPYHGIGLLPANYRLWVKFLDNVHYRYVDFTVNQTNGTATNIAVNDDNWTVNGGLGTLALPGLVISASGLLANETVDVRIVPRYYTYTSGFFSNHSTWTARGFALGNGSSTTGSWSITNGVLYSTYGITTPGDYVIWVYFINSAQYRAWDVTAA